MWESTSELRSSLAILSLLFILLYIFVLDVLISKFNKMNSFASNLFHSISLQFFSSNDTKNKHKIPKDLIE